MKMTLLMDKILQKLCLAPKSNAKNFPGYFFLYVGFGKIRILFMIQTDCRVARFGGFFYIDVQSACILRVEIDEFF